ncbi:MAG TPA: ABC transporter ATP-binding protein [Erysipelothrix sp.]
MIEFFNVRKNFGKKVVFENLHWKIERGSVVGLVGPNGSGKSTLLRMISGILDADHGNIRINDHEIFENIAVKKEIVFVSDDPFFFSQSTIKDMKQFYQVFYERFDEQLYYKLLEVFQLDETVKINNFSKGMKRQVSIVLAFSTNAKIILFDEAFDGLDPLMRFKLRQMIADYIEDKDVIIIISSHNLRELEDICDTVAMIDDKSVKFSRSFEEYHILYHRFRVAFDHEVDPSIFAQLSPLHVSGKSQIFSIIVMGDLEELKQQIQRLNPIINEHSQISLEELYLLQVGGLDREN